ncbi:MAG TPA: SHOCT domain-containing protein [Actinomycetota bacterium]|nr:SHOCT domain-containing protein [Actinomycetota bacterium]
MMFWYGSHLVFWEAALMWVAMIALWALFVWAIYALVTGVAHWRGQPGGDNEARRILDQRLARGEIDAIQYRQLRDALAGREPTGSGANSMTPASGPFARPGSD